MSLPGFVPGLPGVRVAYSAIHRIVFKGGRWDWITLPLGKLIDGANARDWTNTGDLNVLQPGNLMGRITASGLYAPSVVGVSKNAYTSGGTTITVSPASAVEIVRRFGATGNLQYVGPTTANGAAALIASTAYSAVNQTTGAITVTSLGANLVAGGLVIAADGSGIPVTVIPDGYGIITTDIDNITNITNEFPQFPIGGTIISTQLLPVWPSDTGIQAWIIAQLKNVGPFVFDSSF